MKSIKPSERRRARWLETAVAGCPSASDNSAMLRSLSISINKMVMRSGLAISLSNEERRLVSIVWLSLISEIGFLRVEMGRAK